MANTPIRTKPFASHLWRNWIRTLPPALFFASSTRNESLNPSASPSLAPPKPIPAAPPLSRIVTSNRKICSLMLILLLLQLLSIIFNARFSLAHLLFVDIPLAQPIIQDCILSCLNKANNS
ncbi:hypothetical protein IEQ34_019794 [Dendrobium chrysotoxum]|uniref:Uncharacterized protein n=1 Tax=Dendrobium chrysotoxum TaxID=161865 RepID=A0AAV7G9L8_DENCH|nr:hypothetical protein IEQ34_019794 [Dendrobium chrysotoxum]